MMSTKKGDEMKAYIGDFPGRRSKKERKISVTVHEWDTWDLYTTLSHITLPLLRKFREELSGAPNIDDENVPESLRSTSAPPKKNEWDADENWFKRWEWVLDEMIFAHSHATGEIEEPLDFITIPDGINPWDAEEISPPGTPKEKRLYRLKTENWLVDEKRRAEWHKYHERVQNGFRLFGEYYSSLWQ